LNRFANERHQITVFDRRREREPYCTSTKNAAVISGFYDLVDEQGNKDKAAEYLLSQIEGDAKKLLEAMGLGAWNRHPLDGDERKTLSLYIAIQYARTPEHRFQKRVLADLHFRLLLDLNYQRYGRKGLAHWYEHTNGRVPTEDELNAAELVAQSIPDFNVSPHDNMLIGEMFEEAEKIAYLLSDLPWTLLQSRKPKFLTSDRPVTPWREHPRQSRHRGIGLLSADRTFFTIDPRNAIVIGGSGRSPWAVSRASHADICRINGRVAHWSTRYVYHHPQRPPDDTLNFPTEGPIFHINGIPVREGVDVWNLLRKQYIDGTSAPALHFAFGVDARPGPE
jgi:hypothetical protein